MPYRWRYVAVVSLSLGLGAGASLLGFGWMLWVGIAASIAGSLVVARFHGKWLKTATQSTLQAIETEGATKLDAMGSGEEARLEHAVNRLADAAAASVAHEQAMRRYHADVLDTIGDGILIVNVDGELVYSNSAARATGIADSGDEVQGQTVGARVNVFEVADAAKSCLELGSTVHRDVSLFNPIRHLEVWATPVDAGGGAETDSLVIVRDRTSEHRQAESLNEFIANAGHELRTPLAVVQATVETLQLGGRFSGVEAEFLSRVDTSAKRMGALVEELMDLTMMETGKIPLHLAPLAVADLFAATCDELRPIADRRGVEIDDGDVPGDLMVRGDADKLQRALANLVGNGIKFSEPGDTVKLSAAAEGEWVVLRVEDEGRGIDAEHLPRVFDRFFRTESADSDDAGFGLGLAIAKNVIELQGGTVEVESTLGVGSTFSVGMPALRSE